MDRCRFITHKGKQIYLLDFTDSSIEEAQGWFERAAEDIRAQPEGSVLTFIKDQRGKIRSECHSGSQGTRPGELSIRQGERCGWHDPDPAGSVRCISQDHRP